MNPYFCYIFSFAIALLAYALHWSSIYPRLTFSLGLFLFITFFLHGVAGFFWNRKTKRLKEIRVQDDQRPLYVTLFIYFLWLLDFLYEGGIPLLLILFNKPYNYRTFGVPSLHVFAVTFASFYTVYLFHLYLSTRKRNILLLYLINFVAALLIYNRGMLVFNLASSLVLLILAQSKLPRWIIFSSPFAAIIFLYCFGWLGNLRMSREANTPYTTRHFVETGGATFAFQKSVVPNEFFWSYVYLTSAVANLQENVGQSETTTVTPMRIISFINNELIFDFISKRVNNAFQLSTESDHRIPGPFNASTIYSRSYSYLGWFGMIAMAVYVLLLPVLYVSLLRIESPFFLTGLAILCTMFLFMAFDNTIRFTGLSFQLVYPPVFSWLHRKQFFNLIK